ncbi:hypothetical protein UFOVP328_21 [uncultured Caudovirales phage]|uniref:Uncharacterized protein n=1 Tax=uncultured Caudovirales phage TaxID=2100421 RepID=A0A6J5LWN1_9CAUD|nr:hypothetical protein UFOVP328_21 [uncultured Caudovirales phage]
MMSEERQLVAQAVLAGELDADHLTWEEVEEIQLLAAELVAEKTLIERAKVGKAVFAHYTDVVQ